MAGMSAADEQALLDAANALQDNFLKTLGIRTDWNTVQGQSTQQWASQFTGGLKNLGGYYDQGKLNQLTTGLGTTSSDTYAKRLEALAQAQGQIYSYISNPDMVTQKLVQAAKDSGKEYYQIGIGGGLALKTGYKGRNGPGYYDMMGNTYNSFQMSPFYQAITSAGERYSNEQQNLINQSNAQFRAENNFSSQVNQMIQTATTSKLKADQAAAQKALQDKFAAQQAQLDKQAQENAKQIAAQQAEMKQKQQAAQTLQNQNALASAMATTSASQLGAAKIQQQALESNAQATRGGQAQLQVGVTPSKRNQTTNRTDRWTAARSPAPGGGGVKV